MHITEFTEYLLLEKKSSQLTVTAYVADLESFLGFLKADFQDQSLDNASYAQIRSWIVYLVNSGVSNSSVNRKVSSLKSYYKYLLKLDKIVSNPLSNHKALKTSKNIQIPFSESEIVKVLDQLNGCNDFESIRDRLMIELFYASGIRRIELVNLRLSDVDMCNHQIKVVGKRNKERYVPILSSVSETIGKYLSARDEVLIDREIDVFFITKKGVKVYETLVYRVINSYFSRASSKVKTSPHILRHSFATHLLNEGADINAVKELLGHSSLAATQVYTHLDITKLNAVYRYSHPRNKK